MIVDGRAIASDIYKELAAKRAVPPWRDRAPVLGILVASKDPVIESFVAIKMRSAERLQVDMRRIDAGDGATTEDLLQAVMQLARQVDGVIVQLPLPERIDTNAVLSAIPDDKDIDAISTATGEHILSAPVGLAIVEILRRSGVEIQGKRAVVVGAGRLVGGPAAELLDRLGARVSAVSLEAGSLEELRQADIVVCGAGNPGFIKPGMLKEGVALIDAGTSEAGGKVVGDCDPSCAQIASVFTPVPGGVGPVAVAMIFKNLFDLMEGSANR